MNADEQLESVSERFVEVSDRLSETLLSWVEWLPNLLLAVLVLVLGFFLAKFVRQGAVVFSKFSSNDLVADLLRQTFNILIKLGSITLALQLIGAGALVGAVLGTAGVIGLGISFAFKDIVENYLAGIILSIRQPFLKGDHVVLSGQEGVVQRMTTRMTMIKSFDGNNISIPNSEVFKSIITNFSRQPLRRFMIAVGVSPNADIQLARFAGVQAICGVDGVLKEPEALSVVDEIGDSTLNLQFFAWLDQRTHDFFLVRSEAITQLVSVFHSYGIEMPSPELNLRMVGEQRIATEQSHLDRPKNLKLKEELDLDSLEKNKFLANLDDDSNKGNTLNGRAVE